MTVVAGAQVQSVHTNYLNLVKLIEAIGFSQMHSVRVTAESGLKLVSFPLQM